MFSSVLDTRLRNIVSQSIRQKGFTKEDGCKANISLLNSALVQMKTGGGVMTVVDISKAFDTVPHAAIAQALHRKGVPEQLARYVSSMYENCCTEIKTAEEAVQINIRRGVKQGDPLSPLLFNLIIDPIIVKLQEETDGITMQSDTLSVLAFADDMVLLGKNKNAAQRQTHLLDTYLEKLGMSLSIDKCTTFEIKTAHKTWYIKDPELKIRNEAIPNSKPEEIVAYLGMKLSPWSGFRKGIATPTITKAVNNIRRMKLKPHQKLNLIRVYLLPRFIHMLVSCPPPIGTLTKLDSEIRQELKKILHLHGSTTDGLLYTSKSHGGLGMPRMETIVKLAAIRNGIKLSKSGDPLVRQSIGESESRLRSYCTSLGIQWPTTIEEVEEARKKAQRNETERWEQLISQGIGVANFRKDKIGNAWLYNPSFLKPSRYLDALKLRTNTFGTRVVLRRADERISIQCRKCNMARETLGHILGMCIHTKPQRIRRHDEIKNLISEKLSRKLPVFVEPAVSVDGELRKPDLVAKDQERLYVIDVTVRFEEKRSLENAYKEKVAKYERTAEYIKRRLQCKETRIIPIVIGSRGAVPLTTKTHLISLGFTRSEITTMSLIALRSSIEIANAFIDY